MKGSRTCTRERACTCLNTRPGYIQRAGGSICKALSLQGMNVHIKDRLADSDGRKCKKINKEEKIKHDVAAVFLRVLTSGLQILLAFAACVNCGLV